MGQPVLTVRAGTADRPRAVVELSVGESVTVGSCRCGHCGVGLLVLARAPLAVTVTAHEHWWTVANRADDAYCVVTNLEQPSENFVVTAGACVPVPFEIARINSAVEDDEDVVIFGPEQLREPAAANGACSRRAQLRQATLDEAATYFLVLVALCEPLLRGRAGGPPSSRVIARRLGWPDSQTSRRRVDQHLRHVGERLDRGNPAPARRVPATTEDRKSVV